MKTKIELGILFIIFLLSSYLIYNYVGDKQVNEDDSSIIEKVSNDEIKFKEEYESLNGKLNEKANKNYVDVSIKDKNYMKYVTVEEVIDILQNKTGIIYFGFPECPWCRNAVPLLIDAIEEYGIETIYYFNALNIRDIKHLDEENNIVVDKEGTSEYYKIVELLYDYLTPYKELNDETIKRLYFPTVVFVKDGSIVSTHIGTVDSQTDPYVSLTNEQKKELFDIYGTEINKVYDILCDENC